MGEDHQGPLPLAMFPFFLRAEQENGVADGRNDGIDRLSEGTSSLAFLHILAANGGLPMQKPTLYLKNAMLLTLSGFVLRGVGMLFRVWLASWIGAEGMGLYQLALSVYNLAVTFASEGYLEIKLAELMRYAVIVIAGVCFHIPLNYVYFIKRKDLFVN